MLKYVQESKVLVTGATGFVGSVLTRKLLKMGTQVRVLVRESSPKDLVEEFKKAGAKIYYGDLTDRESVFAAVKGVDYVFHVGAMFRQAKFPDEVYYDVNVRGTVNVLDAAEEFGVTRVIHCSTIGVHSHIPNPPANESEPYRPGDVYQRTKCEGEKLAQERFRSGRVDGVIIRPAMIWGEGDKRILKLFRGIARGYLPIIGTGKTYTHWIYVHDLVESFILAAETEAASGQTYIIAGKTPKTLTELYRAIAKRAGVKVFPIRIPVSPLWFLGAIVEFVCVLIRMEPPLHRRRVDFYTKSRCFDTTKAATELGFSPRHDFETEVEKIYQSYKSKGLLN